MAEIKFTGFVEEVLEGRNGPYGVKVAEPHRKKDGGNWVTVARTFHRVTGAYESGINFAGFAKGDRVVVEGRQVTDPYTGQDGEKKYPLVVKADTVAVQERGAGSPAPQPATDSWSTPGSFGDDTPF